MDTMLKSTVAILLIAMMIILSFQLSRVTTTLKVVRDTAEQAVLSQLTINAPMYLKGFRESSGTSRRFDESIWQYMIDDSEAENYMVTQLKLSDDTIKIENLKTEYVNTEGNLIRFKINLTVRLPLVFYGTYVGDIKQNIKAVVMYDTRY